MFIPMARGWLAVLNEAGFLGCYLPDWPATSLGRCSSTPIHVYTVDERHHRGGSKAVRLTSLKPASWPKIAPIARSGLIDPSRRSRAGRACISRC